MAARRTQYTTRRFSSIDLGNGKVYTPIKNEFRAMEYEMALDSIVIGFAQSPEQARISLDEAAAARDEQLADEAAEQPVISEPEATTLCHGAPAYIVTVTHDLIDTRIRLHNDWHEGMDRWAGRWIATEEVAPLGLPAATIAELLALWHRLFEAATPCAHCTSTEHAKSALQPAFCTECVHAMLQPAPDTCTVCTALPASVTLFEGAEQTRICQPCFRAGWLHNHLARTPWSAAEDGPLPDEQEMRSVDLDALRSLVTDSPMMQIAAFAGKAA